ncbi:MAG: amidohydrolase [Gammaproteobacteria bacterium]|nr:amidohydrolase [Gammaproteobacteria bacterium]
MAEPAEIEQGSVLISGNRIAAMGADTDLPDWTADRVLHVPGMVVMPGFVNCHTHIASNILLRGLNEDVQLFEWLSTMWKLKRNFDPETLRLASLVGLAEMALAGITAFNEHFDAYSVTPEVTALGEIPLRATLGYGFADVGLYASIADWSYGALARFGDIVDAHHGALDGRLRVALSPHATYSCTERLWRCCDEVARTHGLSVHTHLSEGEQELRFVDDHYGQSPTAWLASLGVLGSHVTAAHCSMLTAADIRQLADLGVRIAHCPVSNAKLCSGTMPMKAVLEAGITVGLATDGPASHNTLDMFQEMKFCAITHKNANLDPELLPVGRMLALATRDAARAMHLEEVGTLAVGQLADLIVVDVDKPHTAPVYSVPAALVYSSRADDVVHTVVDGRVVVENRSVQGVDVPALLRELRSRALALRDRSLA